MISFITIKIDLQHSNENCFHVLVLIVMKLIMELCKVKMSTLPILEFEDRRSKSG